jgi:hypothetical protein
MKSAILMTSVAVAALAAPAWAGPDRFENGCTAGVNSAPCIQQHLTNNGGKPGPSSNNGAVNGGAGIGGLGGAANAARTGDSNNDETLGNEIGDTADDAGDTISHTANEAGDTISHTANEAGDAIGDTADDTGDAIGHAANEAGDAIGDAF